MNPHTSPPPMTVVCVDIAIELLLEFAEGEVGEEERMLAEGLSEIPFVEVIVLNAVVTVAAKAVWFI